MKEEPVWQIRFYGARGSTPVCDKGFQLFGGNTTCNYVDFKYLLHRHPSGAFSYRIEACGRSVVICTDLEHGTAINPEVVAFCRDADLLIHDAQYTDEQLEKHRGWGHSSYSQAVAVAEEANAKQLIFTHHDPDHEDEFLLAVEEKYQKILPNCTLAREGMEVCV